MIFVRVVFWVVVLFRWAWLCCSFFVVSGRFRVGVASFAVVSLVALRVVCACFGGRDFLFLLLSACVVGIRCSL